MTTTRPLARPTRTGLPPGFVKLLRRGHLYAGLLLAPRVLLYATAAVLFNHPGLRGTPTSPPITARLVAPGAPRACARDETRCTAALVTATLATLNQQLASAGTADTFTLVALDSVTAFSTLSMPVQRAGARWLVSLDLAGDSVPRATAFPRPAPRWREILMQLHTTSGYPPSPAPGAADPRTTGLGRVTQWLWAVLVDALALLLGYWAISGLLMWWQMRSLRRSGALVLALGVLSALGLGLSMAALLRSGP